MRGPGLPVQRFESAARIGSPLQSLERVGNRLLELPFYWGASRIGTSVFLTTVRSAKLECSPVDAGQAGEVLAVDAFVVPGIVDDHPQQVVRIAGHQVALHHLGQLADRALEGDEVVALLAVQGDADEHVVGIAGAGLVDQRHVAAQHAVYLEPPDAAQAG